LASRARPYAARTRLFELIATQNRALRAPPPRPPIAASLLLIQPPKIYKIYRTWAAHVKGFFLPLDHMQTEEAIKYEVPCPRPAHHSFADPSGNILGSKLCTGATKRPNFFRFFLFCMVFGSFLFVILFFLFSSYSSLFILLFLSLLYHSSSSHSSLLIF
jgi:hypothetical protein